MHASVRSIVRFGSVAAISIFSAIACGTAGPRGSAPTSDRPSAAAPGLSSSTRAKRCGPVTSALADAVEQSAAHATFGAPPPVDVGPIARVSSGAAGTCALAKRGDVVCWNGEPRFMGMSTPSYDRVPEPRVRPGVTDAVDVRVGDAHACALLRGGEVRCWGGDLRLLGTTGFPDGREPTLEEAAQAMPVAGIDDAIGIGVSGRHACAVRKGGEVWCWGSSGYGESGEITETVVVPARVSGLPKVAEVAIGEEMGCARSDAGEVWCWGAHDDVDQDPVPRRIGVPAATRVFASGRLACALDARGALRCWGPVWYVGVDGGNGDVVSVELPKKPVELALSEATGLCGAWEGGAVSCLGGVATELAGKPSAGWIDVPALTGATALGMSDAGVCAVGAEGGVQCFGDRRGLGRFSADSVGVVDVVGVTDARDLFVGSQMGCARDARGALRCWGTDAAGRRADAPFAPLTGAASAFGAGRLKTCALHEGKVRCAETPRSDDPIDTEGAVVPLAGAAQTLAVGDGHACATTVDGATWCWGYDGAGQIDGVPTEGEPMSTPKRVAGVVGATALSAGPCSTCALAPGGDVSCWGCNASGELGNGTFLKFGEPAAVVGVERAEDVSVGDGFACARAAGGVRCWGAGARASVAWVGTAGARDVAAGNDEACVVLADGRVTCGVPGCGVDIEGITDAVAVGIASRRACALRADGHVACWGARSVGALGDGESDFVRAPVRVLPRPD